MSETRKALQDLVQVLNGRNYPDGLVEAVHAAEAALAQEAPASQPATPIPLEPVAMLVDTLDVSPVDKPAELQSDVLHLLGWAYSKLSRMTYSKLDDNLALDEIKLLLMGAAPISAQPPSLDAEKLKQTIFQEIGEWSVGATGELPPSKKLCEAISKAIDAAMREPK